MPVTLFTPQGEALKHDPNPVPWQSYPRPQMKRDSYVNLNGYWDFAVGDSGEREHARILVPFCPESPLSGIGRHFPEGSVLCYRRNFTLPGGFNRGRVLLHIGGADQHLTCFVNGREAGRHSGGYEAMTFDITDYLREENALEIQVTDDLRNRAMPYGKQTVKRGGMWYTPVSGIWQTVWLESVPETYIQALNIENRGASVTIGTGNKDLSGTVTVKGLGTFPLVGGNVRIAPENPHFWSPEDPYLYEFTVEAGEDRVESYFALRTLEVKTVDGLPRLCLNGKPYFFHGLLDQGYWPDGLFTPAAAECYEQDILAMKRLGFNTLRKHIKVEPEQFYYDCDRLGMVVFQDMVSNGRYCYLRDTALPTVLRVWQCLPDRHLNRDPAARQEFLHAMDSTVKQLRNHPSICYWTIFNEGWGQFDADRAYGRLRALDDTRFIDTTSGWFRQAETDVDSRHVYFRRVKLKASRKPLVLSEFGGYSYKPEGHAFNPDETYGYGKFTDPEAYQDALETLYREQIIPLVPKGLCAAIYTQLSDVEDETNGLVTYDRKLEKLTPERMKPIARALCRGLAQEQGVF